MLKSNLQILKFYHSAATSIQLLGSGLSNSGICPIWDWSGELTLPTFFILLHALHVHITATRLEQTTRNYKCHQNWYLFINIILLTFINTSYSTTKFFQHILNKKA